MIHVLIRYTNVLNKLEPPHTVSFVTLTGEMYPGFQNLGSFEPLLKELGSEILGDPINIHEFVINIHDGTSYINNYTTGKESKCVHLHKSQ